jgi:hypothetical protein
MISFLLSSDQALTVSRNIGEILVYGGAAIFGSIFALLLHFLKRFARELDAIPQAIKEESDLRRSSLNEEREARQRIDAEIVEALHKIDRRVVVVETKLDRTV